MFYFGVNLESMELKKEHIIFL